MFRAKYGKHIKAGKLKLPNMKYMVKQVIRAAGIANKHDLVVLNWSPMEVMELYLGVSYFFDFICLSSVKRIRYETISWDTYFNALSKRKGQTIWVSVMEYLDLVGLVWYFNDTKYKFMYILPFLKNN